MNLHSLAPADWTVELLRPDATAPETFPRGPIPACVPGCVHTDLIAAGLIGHPNLGFNEDNLQWIGRCDWRYRCRFQTDLPADHERVDLVSESLDTLAEIRLNGRRVGYAANQFHPHRFDVRSALRSGDNELVIDFHSPIRHILAEQARIGPHPINGDWDPYVYIRKSACSFGWDWGPKVAGCGIIGDIRLELWHQVRIAHVRPEICRISDDGWRADVRIDLEWRDHEARRELQPVTARMLDGAQILAEAHTSTTADNVCVPLSVHGVTPWQPRGHGDPRLYDLEISIGEFADRTRRRIGFRTVELDTRPDEHGQRFNIRVNGRPIFILGANWIPEGLFPVDRTPERIRARLDQAAAANLNLLRVWGGGQYESDAYYERCDELGLLVWQDFMFACAMYPEEEPPRSQVEAEARHQIARLSSHPCVALWCGGNECVWAWQGWGFGPRLKPGQTWGRGYYLDLLPRLITELDPTRPYWPNTPWSGSLDADVQDASCGTRHTWDRQVAGYREVVPRFTAEFGHQSPPNFATLAAALPPDQLAIDSPALRHRQRAAGGNATRYDQPLAEHFAPPRDFDEWLYLSHLLQARAIGLGIEWLRVHRDRCGGAVFWQFNDAWAGHSWSAVDPAGRAKPLWYAVRRACAPRRLTIQPIDGAPTLFAVNDAGDAWRGEVRARRVDFDGRILSEATLPLAVEPGRASRIADLTQALGEQGRRNRELLVVDLLGASDPGENRATWYFDLDQLLDHPEPAFDAAISNLENGVVMQLTARTLIRDLVLAADRIAPDAATDRQMVTWMPGEWAKLVISGF